MLWGGGKAPNTAKEITHGNRDKNVQERVQQNEMSLLLIKSSPLASQVPQPTCNWQLGNLTNPLLVVVVHFPHLFIWSGHLENSLQCRPGHRLPLRRDIAAPSTSTGRDYNLLYQISPMRRSINQCKVKTEPALASPYPLWPVAARLKLPSIPRKNTSDEAVDALTTIWNYQELGFAFSGSQLLTVPTYIKYYQISFLAVECNWYMEVWSPLSCDLPASTVGRPLPPRPRSGVRTSRRLRWRATAGQPTSATARQPTASAAFHPSHLQPIAAQPGTQYSRWQYIVLEV